jgi:hypothetical protein
MATVRVALPADLVLDIMILSDIHNAQDAVEAVLRDYVQRGRRTEAVTGTTPEARRDLEDRRLDDGGRAGG